MQLSCPKCAARDADVLKGPGAAGAIKALFGVYELRCRRCKTRWETSAEWRYARCPRCYRQDLTSWSPDDYRLGGWTTWLLRMGATRFRCSPCRFNFASFRPPKDRVAWEQKVSRAKPAPIEAPEAAPVQEPAARARVNGPASRASLTAPAARRFQEDSLTMKPVKAGKAVRTRPVQTSLIETKPVEAKAAWRPIESTPVPKLVEMKPLFVPPSPKLIDVKPVAPEPAPVQMPRRSDAEIRESLNAGATVGKTVRIKGRIISGEDLTIDGEVDGTVEVLKHCLRVEANGNVRAGITAHDVIVLGRILGDVETADRLDIRKGANLTGDIKAHRLLIEDGASVQGQVVTGDSSG